jgi:tRNA modification GTPase
MIEAELDFADESDVPGSVSDAVWADMERLLVELEAHIGSYHRSEIIRDGYDVVIMGPPNAGKSSLLNALARRDVAIVSDEAGTTRDLVELSLDLDGVKVRLTDTAGIRDDAGKIEAIGIDRARRRAEIADLVLLLCDPGQKEILDASYPNVLRVGTKLDTIPSHQHRYDIGVSSVTGEGIAELLALLSIRAAAAIGDAGDVIPSRLRHVELLREAAYNLEMALRNETIALELRADDLRLAADRLGRISGTVDVEDLLDVIFSQFCIGK